MAHVHTVVPNTLKNTFTRVHFYTIRYSYTAYHIPHTTYHTVYATLHTSRYAEATHTITDYTLLRHQTPPASLL